MLRSRAPQPLITSYALATALGSTRAAVVEALRHGRSGLRPASRELPFATVCGALPEDPPPLPAALARFDTRLARLGASLAATLRPDLERAFTRWGPERVGLFIGTSTAGIASTEHAWRHRQATGALPAAYEFVAQHTFGGLLDVLRQVTGVAGPGFVVSTACSSGAKVFGSAQRLIAHGVIDAAVVGGLDTLCETTLFGFHSLSVLATEPCRPFSAERAGISLGEGGALVLLERDGVGRARLLSVGESSDAHHISAPHPEGAGARAALLDALAQAGLAPAAVHHVNAHGTGTPQNDRSEALAIAAVLGQEVPVVSTKGYTGHLLGAAGAVEAVLAVLALEEGWIPASLGAAPVDPALPIHVALARAACAPQVVASNSFAFGGNNTCVLLGAA